MAAPILMVAAIVCPLVGPVIDRIADAIPRGPGEVALIPVVVLDIGCAVINHSPLSFGMVEEIGPHVIGAIRGIGYVGRALGRIGVGLDDGAEGPVGCGTYLAGRRGSMVAGCVGDH